MKTINIQPASEIDRGDGATLLVHSIFYTIQGEGPHVGRPAVFIRLGGCNLQCPGCDTDYTPRSDVRWGIDEIMRTVHSVWMGDSPRDALQKRQLPLVVITGGEPFRQNITVLINSLFNAGYHVQIESNGTLAPHNPTSLNKAAWGGLEVVVSPKAGKVHTSLHHFISAYKYVLDADHISEADGLPTSVLGMPAAPARPHADFEGDVYVQPADEPQARHPEVEDPLNVGEFFVENNKRNLDATIKSAMKYGYRLCLQTHKIAGLE